MRGSACSLRVRSADYSGGLGGLAELASSSQRIRFVPTVKPSLLVMRGRSTTRKIARVILLQAGDPNCTRVSGDITMGQGMLRYCAGEENDVVFFRG